MTSPSKTIGYLTLKNAQQVTVSKRLKGKLLVAMSAQEKSQHEVTFYEWGKDVAFLFKCDGTYCFPKVKGNSLEMGEYAEEKIIPNKLGKEYLFNWAEEDQGEYYRLEHKTENVEMFLCCDDQGSLFLKDRSAQSGRKVDCYLYKKEMPPS